MSPCYPIFTVDREGWISIVGNKEDILSVHEQIDIEEGEYSGWDANGYPIKLSWDTDKGLCVMICQEDAQPDQLRAAILRYAALACPEPPFEDKGFTNTIDLFNAIELHVEKNSRGVLSRIKRIFGVSDRSSDG